jgi:GTP-binding protein HflX
LDADRVPQIRVYNKIDKLDRAPKLTNNLRGEGRAVWLSAETGDGIPLLLSTLGDRLRPKMVNGSMRLRADQGRRRAKLFELGAVVQESPSDDGGWTLQLQLGERDFNRFLKSENLSADILEQSGDKTPTTALTQR